MAVNPLCKALSERVSASKHCPSGLVVKASDTWLALCALITFRVFPLAYIFYFLPCSRLICMELGWLCWNHRFSQCLQQNRMARFCLMVDSLYSSHDNLSACTVLMKTCTTTRCYTFWCLSSTLWETFPELSIPSWNLLYACLARRQSWFTSIPFLFVSSKSECLGPIPSVHHQFYVKMLTIFLYLISGPFWLRH